MRALVKVLLITSVLLLSACATKPAFQQDTTLRTLDGQKVRLKPVELPIIKRRDVQSSYQTLLETTDDPQYQAVALQRLADLGLESVREQLEADESETTNNEVALKLDLDRVILRYEDLLERFPDYVGNPRVYYQLAWAHELKGEPSKTLTTLTRLLERFPSQANRAEVEFRRAEILFSQRDYVQAEIAYNDILQLDQNGEFFERALFKHGWSVFKQGDMLRALESYFTVLDRNFTPARDQVGFSRSEQELLDDTLRIISISFAYLEGSKSIGEFFADYGARTYEHKVYQRLAKLYLDQQRIQDSTGTYLEFVDRYPLHIYSPVFMTRVMEIYQQASMANALLETKSRFVMEYGVDSPFWSSQDGQSKAALSLSLQNNLQDLSSYYHARARKSRHQDDYQLAAQWYEKYVQWFPNEAQTSHYNFLLAENLLDSGDMQAAAKAFEHVAYQYPQHGQSAEAGYAALLAYRQQIEALQGRARLDKRLEAIDSSRRFVTFYGSDRRAVDVLSTLAEDMMELGNFRDALGMANKVVTHEPKAAQRLLSINWDIIAQANFALGNYADTELATRKLLEFLPGDDHRRISHVERLAASIYKQAEQAQGNEDYRAAAQHFLRIGKLAPEASIRVNAEYDAATAYFANQDWELAIPVLQTFVESYPAHELRQGAEEKLALLYEKQGDWLKTAGAYEVLYEKEKEQNKKRLLLWQIAEYYQKAKQSGTAVTTYKRYVKAFPNPYADAMEARYRLAELYKADGKMAERYWWLERIIKIDKKGPSTERSRFLAAMASMELAQVKQMDFSRVRLVSPLKKNLKKKKKLMQASIKAYTRASDYRLETVTTELTYRIGEIYHAFSQALFDSERPKGLSAEELEQYDILLEEQAYPFEEKAIEVHLVNIQRTRTGIYDAWVRKSFDTLAKLSPVRYGKTEKGELLNEHIQ